MRTTSEGLFRRSSPILVEVADLRSCQGWVTHQASIFRELGGAQHTCVFNTAAQPDGAMGWV
jgi:hypothetical protein